MILDYVAVAAGLVALVLAGDALVKGAVGLARRFGVSVLFIGLTVVAFGTSAPELVVSVDAVLSGAPALALGNVVGSNIANTSLIIGIPALIAPVICADHGVLRNVLIMIAATLIVIALAFMGGFGFASGLLLVALLAAYVWSSARHARRDKEAARAVAGEVEELAEHKGGWSGDILRVLVGLGGLVLGARLLVMGAVAIARDLGVSEAVIGLSLVALGTSLPELATGVMAALRRHGEVIIGNVVGSNIFNLLGILGAAAMVGDIPVAREFLVRDVWVMLASSLVLLPFVLKRSALGRVMGLVVSLGYIGYIVALAG